jgi:hypothetical protein
VAHELGDVPGALAPYAGKIALFGGISAAVDAGQGFSVPTFFVWHRPELPEFVVCQLEDWINGPKNAVGLGCHAFADLISGLPR